ncbi:hypothetical protein B0H19DRAFT_1077185 [Mycena capillaripes]|nr:hypothetical protein B0H19DRAFT_1077185 [Mycena capillaripes]
MSKRKRPPENTQKERSATAEEKAERRRQTTAAYHQRPDVREKQRVRMAEKRAAVKARRRQWDPPKKNKMGSAKSASLTPTSPPLTTSAKNPHPHSIESESDPTGLVNSNADVDHDADIVWLTSAERFALDVLMEMGEARSERIEALATKYGPKPPPSSAAPFDGDGGDSLLELALELSSQSSVASHSRHSSVAAVHEDPINARRGQQSCYSTEPLARNVAPATHLQKKLQREVGLIGPLTAVQQAQVLVSDLARSLTASVSDDDGAEIATRVHGSSMSSERWERVWNWRRKCTESGTGWEDPAARRAFAEAVLQERLLY